MQINMRFFSLAGNPAYSEQIQEKYIGILMVHNAAPSVTGLLNFIGYKGRSAANNLHLDTYITDAFCYLIDSLCAYGNSMFSSRQLQTNTARDRMIFCGAISKHRFF